MPQKCDQSLIFIGGMFPSEILPEYLKDSKGAFQFAADNFQKGILDGLSTLFNNISIVSVPFLGNFPGSFTKVIVKEGEFRYKNFADVKVLKFVNVKGIDLLSKYLSLKAELKRSIYYRNGKPIVLFYGVFPYFLKLASWLKKNDPSIGICLIVPDLPEMMGGDNSKFKVRMYNTMMKRMVKRHLKSIDGFILLSKHMVDYLEIGHKPFEVVEGIYNEKDVSASPKEKNTTILYTGTLAKRYGILNLVHAFSEINDDNFRLWICGDGDGKEELLNFIKRDNRIIYYGQLKQDEIIKLQKKATMLVNPRTSEGEYTKYSFPSKTIEYLASGTPTIMYKLEGVPADYYNYCIVCEKETIQDLKEKILLVSKFDETEIKLLGDRARKFILTQKNAAVQANKIARLITNL